MSRIFVSYRREDTSGHAGRLFDGLASHFGREAVFMDVDTIGAGADFADAIEEAVGGADAFLALIGKRWLSAADEEGKRRLDDPEDFVRLEVATALGRRVRVIPVLLDGGAMPSADELPEALAGLHRRNALEIRDGRWDADMGELVSALEEIGVQPTPARLPWHRTLRGRLAAGAMGLLAIVAGFTAWKITRPTMQERLEMGVQRPQEQIPALGVVPFSSRVKDLPDSFGTDLAGLIYGNLNQSKHLKPFSPSTLAALGGEESDEASLLKAASEQGIGYLLTGTIFPDPEGLTISFRLTDTRSGADLASGSHEGLRQEAAFRISKPIALETRQALRVPIEEQVDFYQADFAVGHPDAYNRYVTGLQYLVKYRYEEAEEAFLTALELAPGFGMAHYRLGQILLTSGREPEGHARLEQATADLLSEREKRYVRIVRALWAKSFDEAEEEARALVDLYPADTEARFLVAQALETNYRFREVVKHLSILTELESTHLIGWSMLANAHLELGELDAAGAAAERILELEPEDANAHVLLGRSLRGRGELDRAEEAFRSALALNPSARLATAELATVIYLLGRHEEAEEILQRLAHDSQGQQLERVQAAVELAEMLRAAGRFSAAEEMLARLERQFADIDSYRADGLALRGLCLLEIGKLDAAAGLVARAIDNLPSDAAPTRYLFARGLLELSWQRTAEVRRTAEEILAAALPPDNPDRTEEKAASYLRGMALLAEGDTAAAVTELAAAAELTAHDYPYRVYSLGLARALFQAGEPSRALAVAEAAAGPGSPANPRIWLDLDRRRALLLQAEIQQAMGEQARAKELAREFLGAWARAEEGLLELRLARRIAAGQGQRAPAIAGASSPWSGSR
jgi:tetratricopeptide (TPR) repeat protein